MAEDEKTCIEHRTYQNVRMKERCFLHVLLYLQGTRKWSYSDGSYRYSNVNPPGSTYYNDGHGHSFYDRYAFKRIFFKNCNKLLSGPNRENPYMRFKDTDKNLERVVQKPNQWKIECLPNSNNNCMYLQGGNQLVTKSMAQLWPQLNHQQSWEAYFIKWTTSCRPKSVQKVTKIQNEVTVELHFWPLIEYYPVC